MVRRGVAADEDEQIGVVHVVEGDGGGAGAERARQADAAGLMAVVRAIVDVIGPVKAGEELQEEAGLVGRPAAGVEEALQRRRVAELAGEAVESLVPGDDAVMSIIRSSKKRLGQPTAPFQLAR